MVLLHVVQAMPEHVGLDVLAVLHQELRHVFVDDDAGLAPEHEEGRVGLLHPLRVGGDVLEREAFRDAHRRVAGHVEAGAPRGGRGVVVAPDLHLTVGQVTDDLATEVMLDEEVAFQHRFLAGFGVDELELRAGLLA